MIEAFLWYILLIIMLGAATVGAAYIGYCLITLFRNCK